MEKLRSSFAAGYACLAAWSDLLDQINVFPVADGDTGTNLRISLIPLRDSEQDGKNIRTLLTRGAIGNSGNIAVAFFRELFLAEQMSDLAGQAAIGREKAWQAIAAPCKGTMLSVFDSLAENLTQHALSDLSSLYSLVLPELQKAVRSTPEHLPSLKKAGVVDAGALGMYIYFEGFLRSLTDQAGKADSVLSVFRGQLDIQRSFLQPKSTEPTDSLQGKQYCVDVILRKKMQGSECQEKSINDTLRDMGESVVVLEDESQLKVHIHTDEPEQLYQKVSALGTVIHWDAEEMREPLGVYSKDGLGAWISPAKELTYHILTDAAGSITREAAEQHGISLLDTYIIAGNDARPESLCDPAEIYARQREGGRVTTAQASSFERYQHYASLIQQFGPCLYLSVGSAFTGNYAAAMAWKKEHDRNNLLTVVDTGTASGRLALIALLTSRYMQQGSKSGEVLSYLRILMKECREYVFIDELKYLVAGGRISKAGGFFGDLFGVKPVVSPINNIVQKMGIARSRKGQLAFALEKLKKQVGPAAHPLILLQYSDNEDWLREFVLQAIQELLPAAEIILTPLSLSSGVHMGPGTWAMAFAPKSL